MLVLRQKTIKGTDNYYLIGIIIMFFQLAEHPGPEFLFYLLASRFALSSSVCVPVYLCRMQEFSEGEGYAVTL